MRFQGRQAQGRVRQGRRGKLRAAAAWEFRPKAEAETDAWQRELAAAYPERAWLREGLVEPPKKELWHAFYWEAWHSLRYDRQYIGQLGEETPISFMAIDAYARRRDIGGEAFDLLLRFVTVIDVEYIAVCAEQRAETLKAKFNPNAENTQHG